MQVHIGYWNLMFVFFVDYGVEKLILHHLTEKCEEKTTGVLYGDYFFPH